MKPRLAIMAIFATLLVAAPMSAQQFGEPLSLAEATSISNILADPSAFEGKLVQLRGTIMDVCPRAGCYVVIGEGDRQMTFKVEDGAMVFAPELKGREITAEGIVALVIPKPEPTKEAQDDCGGGCCEKKAAPPKPSARLNGVGALVK